jgi:hypothetical protein
MTYLLIEILDKILLIKCYLQCLNWIKKHLIFNYQAQTIYLLLILKINYINLNLLSRNLWISYRPKVKMKSNLSLKMTLNPNNLILWK